MSKENCKPLIYLASPYNHEVEDIRRNRFEIITMIAAHLMKQGHLIIAPIVHSHNILKHHNLGCGWEYWAEHDTAILTRCDELWITKMNGWNKSVGIAAEIEIARSLNMPLMQVNFDNFTRHISSISVGKFDE